MFHRLQSGNMRGVDRERKLPKPRGRRKILLLPFPDMVQDQQPAAALLVAGAEMGVPAQSAAELASRVAEPVKWVAQSVAEPVLLVAEPVLWVTKAVLPVFELALRVVEPVQWVVKAA
jgi:hypothetical protein